MRDLKININAFVLLAAIQYLGVMVLVIKTMISPTNRHKQTVLKKCDMWDICTCYHIKVISMYL